MYQLPGDLMGVGNYLSWPEILLCMHQITLHECWERRDDAVDGTIVI